MWGPPMNKSVCFVILSPLLHLLILDMIWSLCTIYTDYSALFIWGPSTNKIVKVASSEQMVALQKLSTWRWLSHLFPFVMNYCEWKDYCDEPCRVWKMVQAAQITCWQFENICRICITFVSTADCLFETL